MVTSAARSRAAFALTAVLLVVALAATPTASSAATKDLSGELVCPAFDWVTNIWFLGSESGWHGRDVPASELPRTWYDAQERRKTPSKYKFTAVKGETIQYWITCSFKGKKYGSFTVGSGGTRHICNWYGGFCGSIGRGECAVKYIFFSKNPIGILGCLLK